MRINRDTIEGIIVLILILLFLYWIIPADWGGTPVEGAPYCTKVNNATECY